MLVLADVEHSGQLIDSAYKAILIDAENRVDGTGFDGAHELREGGPLLARIRAPVAVDVDDRRRPASLSRETFAQLALAVDSERLATSVL